MNGIMSEMSEPEDESPSDLVLSPSEREYLRRELDVFFSSQPSIADGLFLKRWRRGDRADQPKLPPAASAMLRRNLLRLDASGTFPRLFFTEKGLQALRLMMSNRRFADPEKFRHIRRELGIEASDVTEGSSRGSG